MKNLLTQIFGFPATLIHGDTLVLDRWRWLKSHVPEPSNGHSKLLDVGCGTGSFTIGLSKLGYETLGLTWNEDDTRRSENRARMCNAPKANFSVQDVRYLDQRKEFVGKYDVIVCTENIEHILNDQKLMTDMAACLKPGGKLYLTTPNMEFIPMDNEDDEPLSTVEDGGHVRRGYTPEDFQRLCKNAGLKIKKIDYVSGFLSQKITGVWRVLNRVNPMISFALTLPLRVIPPLFDDAITKSKNYPKYSISLVAEKPEV